MLIGFDIEAAKKRADPSDQPAQETMRGTRQIIRNPSTDQRKIRNAQRRQQHDAKTSHEARIQTHPEMADGHSVNVTRDDAADHGVVEVSDIKPGQTPREPTGPFFHRPRPDSKTRGHSLSHGCQFCSGYGTDASGARECPACGGSGAQYSASKTATETASNADRLNAGDKVRGPNGQIINVQQVRLHPTNQSKVIVVTDQGAIEANRTDPFTRVEQNAMQQEIPTDQGTFGGGGGNSNTLPGGSIMDRAKNQGQGHQTGNQGGGMTCPIDGSPMQLHNGAGGSTYVCPRDGFTQQAGGIGGASDPTQLYTRAPGGPGPSQGADRPYGQGSIASIHGSAIAQRARQVLKEI